MPYWLPISSFLLCLTLTPVVRIVARRKGWLAHPKEDRWHKKPTALMGGVAIYIAISAPLFWLADFSSILSYLAGAPGQGRIPSIAAAAWIGATFLFILGLVDDFIQIRPYTKLVGQIIAASMVVFLGFRLHWFTSMTLDATVTFLWIIGLTNAFNLLDNMDGLCAGVGLVASVFLAALFFGNAPEALNISLILAGALAAFLIYNYNPASIFMGDSGSLTIGFTLSVVSLYFAQFRAANPVSAAAIPIMVLLVPIMDTSLVTFIRLLSGRKASMGGRDHTSHRLVLMGFSERSAVLFLYGIGAVSGVSALFVRVNDTLTSPAVIIPLTLSVLLMGVYLSQIRVYPEKEFSRLRGRTFTPILVELTYKRQLTLVMLDFCLVAFAYYLSYRLRFDSREFAIYFKVFLQSLPVVIACKFAAFFAMGVYRGIWRYLSTDDISVCIKASTLASLLAVVAVTYMFRFENFSKGIFVIDWLLTMGFTLGARGSFRLFLDAMNRRTLAGDKVVIYGAGRGGEILLRELLNNKKLAMNPVGFIDDDLLKIGRKIQGLPILGAFQDLGKLQEKHGIFGLIISFNHNDSARRREIRGFCRSGNLFLKQFRIHLESVDLEGQEDDKQSGADTLIPGRSTLNCKMGRR